MKLIFSTILILSLINFLACNSTEPEIKGSLGLTLDSVKVTEVWFTLVVGNLSNTAFVTLKQNDEVIDIIDPPGTKTQIYIDSLQPSTNYVFQAFSSFKGEEVVSNKLMVTTLDTMLNQGGTESQRKYFNSSIQPKDFLSHLLIQGIPIFAKQSGRYRFPSYNRGSL